MAVSAAQSSPPQLYTLQTLAEAGYGAVPTLRRAIREGRLAAVHVGGRVKIPADALDAYVRESSARAAENGGE